MQSLKQDLNNSYSVSQINNLIKNYLEKDFLDIYIQGEVDELNCYASKHWYFKLKESKNNIIYSIPCVMFANYNQFAPKISNNNSVILKGKLSLYPKSGLYQFVCTQIIIKDILGFLQQQFQKLYEKLNKENIFANKIPLKKFINKIAIVSALNSAAVQDMLKVYRNKQAFLSELYLFDCLVQGDMAAKSIIQALKKAISINPCVIIIARGGGSKQDLFCFNDEELVRFIASIKITIVTGIGHQIDTHLSDFAASYHLATPTAAMEFVLYDKDNLMQNLNNHKENLKNIFSKKIAHFENQLLFYQSKFSKIQIMKNYENYEKGLNAFIQLFKKEFNNKLSKHLQDLTNKEEKLKQKTQIIFELKNNYIQKQENNININNLLTKIENSFLYLNSLEEKLKQNFTFKIQQEEQKLNYFIKILNSQKDFFENIAYYVKITKDNKVIKLQDLKENDFITLSNNECVKYAQIIKRSKNENS